MSMGVMIPTFSIRMSHGQPQLDLDGGRLPEVECVLVKVLNQEFEGAVGDVGTVHGISMRAAGLLEGLVHEGKLFINPITHRWTYKP
jgi:hypothetical protein